LSPAALARVAATLRYLGYGTLGEQTWVAPRRADEVDGLLAEAQVSHERFVAEHSDGLLGAADLVHRAWDLTAVGEAYGRFVDDLRPVVTPVGEDDDDEYAYAARFRLVHAWRAFLFRDPQLPPALLPPHWPGTTAAAFFDRHEARLRPAADRYVDGCLEPLTATHTRSGKGQP
jgi:phenylacetic acid degradation operon negative regulatory protein